MSPPKPRITFPWDLPRLNGCMPASANIHIDKMRIFLPCRHQPLGKTMYLDDPELGPVPVGATADRRMLKQGGRDAYVRSKDIDTSTGYANTLEIHCCPPQYLQKHNVFGHGNLPSYAYTVADLITLRLGIQVPDEDRLDWMQGNIRVTEVHLTANFACPADHILQIISAVDENNPSGKSRPIPSWITLGLTRNRRSSYCALTLYGKYLQLLEMFPRKPGPYQTRLLELARNTIRAEVKLYSKEIKYLDLGSVWKWCDKDVAAIFFEQFAKYNVYHAIQRLLTDDELAELTKAERRAYTLWLKGENLADFYGRTSRWKLADDIDEKVGVNITGDRRPEELPEIDLRAVFAPENVVPVPNWLLKSERYWGPYVTPYKRTSISRVPVITDEELHLGVSKQPPNIPALHEGDVPY